jgi:ArsR family transcriptional regulator
MKINIQEKIYKALAHAGRLQMIKYLRNMKYASVTTVANMLNMSVKTTSKHLQILEQAGIISSERHGVQVYYAIKKPLPPLIRSIISFL